MKTILLLLFVFIFTPLFFSCGNKSGEEEKNKNNEKREFGWRDDISESDIPDFPVKGFIKGKEVQFAYVNFERWRGSNDNVLNFSVNKPEQECGFIENYSGFTLLNMSGEIKTGKWIKPKFESDAATYKASVKSGGVTTEGAWNCALNIESVSDKTAKGKIVIFFNDNSKSWIAGSFEALICNN